MSTSEIAVVSSNAALERTASSEESALSKATVDYDMFLKLLVSQMQNQDPLNPAESTEYVAQLATFSQVEQSIQMNAKLADLLAGFQLSQSDAILGRTLTSADGSISGTVNSVQFTQDGLIANLDNGERVAVGPGVVLA